MREVQKAPIAFKERTFGQDIFLMSDSFSAVVYVNKHGKLLRDLCQLTWKIFLRIEMHVINHMTRFILGRQNVVVEQLSRYSQIILDLSGCFFFRYLRKFTRSKREQ